VLKTVSITLASFHQGPQEPLQETVSCQNACLKQTKKASVLRFAAFLLHLLESPLIGLMGPLLNDPYTKDHLKSCNWWLPSVCEE